MCYSSTVWLLAKSSTSVTENLYKQISHWGKNCAPTEIITSKTKSTSTTSIVCVPLKGKRAFSEPHASLAPDGWVLDGWYCDVNTVSRIHCKKYLAMFSLQIACGYARMRDSNNGNVGGRDDSSRQLIPGTFPPTDGWSDGGRSREAANFKQKHRFSTFLNFAQDTLMCVHGLDVFHIFNDITNVRTNSEMIFVPSSCFHVCANIRTGLFEMNKLLALVKWFDAKHYFNQMT